MLLQNSMRRLGKPSFIHLDKLKLKQIINVAILENGQFWRFLDENWLQKILFNHFKVYLPSLNDEIPPLQFAMVKLTKIDQISIKMGSGTRMGFQIKLYNRFSRLKNALPLTTKMQSKNVKRGTCFSLIRELTSHHHLLNCLLKQLFLRTYIGMQQGLCLYVLLYQGRRKGGCTGCTCTPSFQKLSHKSAIKLKNLQFQRVWAPLDFEVHPLLQRARDAPDSAAAAPGGSWAERGCQTAPFYRLPQPNKREGSAVQCVYVRTDLVFSSRILHSENYFLLNHKVKAIVKLCDV